MIYNEWLNATYQQSWETDSSGDIKVLIITNQMVMDNPPQDWFNPWLLTEQEIDQMREEFKGSGYKWAQHVKDKLPNLCPVQERKKKIKLNKVNDIKRCGSEITWIDKKGLIHRGIYHCKHYDICPICQHNREKEHLDRLMKLDGCRVVEGQRAELAARFPSTNIYSFKLQDGREISIVDTDEKIGVEMDYQFAKELSKITVTGNRVSGKLGKDESPAKEEPKDYRTVTVSSFVIEASSEVKKQIEREYLEQTKNFLPETLDELAARLSECNSIYYRIAKRLCENIHFIKSRELGITELDLDWSDRLEYIKKRLKGPALV